MIIYRFDIDKTLDDYIQYFRKELAVHLPLLQKSDRQILPKLKDLYLAKGSEASYKLLFRLLYGKNVELTYPGLQMLKASDGTWNQEISVFARVDYGNPDDIVGLVTKHQKHILRLKMLLGMTTLSI